ncbi:MAG: tetratricopeptide repeat protein [Actinoallomurus sp.]
MRLGDEEANPVVERIAVEWPLDAEALEDLRWYLEDYLRWPFAVYSDRGSEITDKFRIWGEALFQSIFGVPEILRAYSGIRARGNRVELVFRSASPQRLGLPWELMWDPSRGRPLALDGVAVTRDLPVTGLSGSFPSDGDRLRVLMVICRPRGDQDVGYQMIARPLLERLDVVRGKVDLVVLRPPTLDRLREVLTEAVEAGAPFQVVHFDGHGVFGEAPAGWSPVSYQGPVPRGMLAFERLGGGPDLVPAERVAEVLSAGRVPVVVLNACQSGQVGAQMEAAIATRLVQDGAASVVAMAYGVYAVAAAEFMTAFYERLFAGDRVADAVTAGRARLSLRNERPSPKGKLPLADWVVPVHYRRRDVRFPDLRTSRTAALSLDEMLDRHQAPKAETGEDLAPVGTFVGRDGLFYTLETAARLQRVVVLHGTGGTGKSELVKAFGRWWRDTAGVDRPEYVIWHSFEPGVSSFGLNGVVTDIGLRVFGVRFALAEPDQRRQVVRDLLREHRLLLIWDNFETVHSLPDPDSATPTLDEGAREELKDFLADVAGSGQSSILITSRTPEEWLGDVRRVEVGGLDADEAIEYAERLLVPFPRTLARRQGEAYAELTEWLDGHPLSMRLVLPLLDTTDADTLLAGLRGATPLPGRDDADRTGSLPASIAYSFTHLSDDDQQALVVVALFHGIADSDVLAALSQSEEVPARFADRTGDDWARVLEAATAVGLLTRLGTGMYRIHPALPTYLTGQWRADRPATFDQEHAATTRALLDANAAFGQWLREKLEGGNAGATAMMIELQSRNLGHMLAYAFDARLWDHAQAIAEPFALYWERRGLSEEAQSWAGRARPALEAPDGTPPGLDTSAGKLWLLFSGIEALRPYRARRLNQAHDAYRKLLDALERHPETSQQQSYVAVTYNQLGVIARERRRWEEAEDCYRRAIAIREELGESALLAVDYYELGLLALQRDRLEEAEDWCRRSLARSEEHDDRPTTLLAYHQLGIIADRRELVEEAEDWYRRALSIGEELQAPLQMASSHHQLGNIALKCGRLEEAEDWYRRSLTLKEKFGDRRGIANTYHQLGRVARQRGRVDEAEDWYRRSRAIQEEFDTGGSRD